MTEKKPSKYATLSEISDMKLRPSKINVNPNGKSFLKCPTCKSELYFPCKCEPKNYACANCNWIFYNHEHVEESKPKEGPGNLHSFRIPN